jgi:hypothetical protein
VRWWCGAAFGRLQCGDVRRWGWGGIAVGESRHDGSSIGQELTEGRRGEACLGGHMEAFQCVVGQVELGRVGDVVWIKSGRIVDVWLIVVGAVLKVLMVRVGGTGDEVRDVGVECVKVVECVRTNWGCWLPWAVREIVSSKWGVQVGFSKLGFSKWGGQVGSTKRGCEQM